MTLTSLAFALIAAFMSGMAAALAGASHAAIFVAAAVMAAWLSVGLSDWARRREVTILLALPAAWLAYCLWLCAWGAFTDWLASVR